MLYDRADHAGGARAGAAEGNRHFHVRLREHVIVHDARTDGRHCAELAAPMLPTRAKTPFAVSS